MKLNNRYRRSIKSNLSFYLAASLLTMVALLAFYIFYVAGIGINNYADDFFEKTHLEDAAFSTNLPISEADQTELENQYHVSLEAEQFVNCKEADYTARVFRANKKIDLYEVIEGSDVASDDDIILSAGYAHANNISVGDSIQIKGKDFHITGFFLRPDYLYMLENLSDSYKNVSTFFLGIVTDSEFDQLFDSSSVTYKVLYHDSEQETAFREAVNDSYYMLSYVDANSNSRIVMVHHQADMYLSWAWMMLILLPLITVILISIVIGRKIKAEQRLIGTLSALGYKKRTLMLHYSLLAILPGLFGGILVTIISLFAAQPYGELTLTDYEPLQATFHLPIGIAILGLLIPTIIYLCAGMLKVRKLLKHDVVELLHNTVEEDTKTHKLLINSNKKVKFKFALRSLIGSPGRTLIIFLGIFLGAMMVSLGFLFTDSVHGVGDAAKKVFGDFKYEYVLNTIETEAPTEGETLTAVNFEDLDGNSFTLLGMDADTELWNLKTTEGDRADLKQGWYISSLFATIFDLSEGDSFTFRSVTTLEEYTVQVAGIIENGFNNYMVSTKEQAAEITDLDPESYNAVISQTELHYDDSIVSSVITSDTLKDQMDAMIGENNAIIYALLVIAAIICISALYIAINLMISENTNNISMLKVLGYDNKKINAMVLNLNQILLIPGIILGIAFSYFALNAYKTSYATVVHAIIPIQFNFVSVLITAGFVCLCYYVSLFFLKKKVHKINMAESLMSNRE